MEADKNEGDETLDLQNSVESSGEDQLKEDRHKDKRTQDRSRSARNRNMIKSREGEGEIEQGSPENGTECRSKRSMKDIKPLSFREM